MNEKRFLELLNLYIDDEISPEEREILDREVAGNAQRRATYLSYCRLCQASQRLSRKHGQELVQTVDLRKYQILARDSSRSCFRRGLLYSTGALAAACLTVAAAVAVFQDDVEEAGFVQIEGEALRVVEVLDPRGINVRRTERPRPVFREPEPFIFGGRSEFARSPRGSRYFDPAHVSFATESAALGWDQPSHFGSPPPRNSRNEEPNAGLTSFQFQR